MNKIKLISSLVSLAMLASYPLAYADSNQSPLSAFESEGISALDFPEGEGISFAEDEANDIEMPLDEDYASLNADNETVYISTVDDLNNLKSDMMSSSHYTSGKTYILQNDIDLGGKEWSPLGYSADYKPGSTEELLKYAFNGVFDGNGYTIRNFKMSDNQYNYMGFFGVVAGGTVKNLSIEDASINYIYDISNGSYGSSHYPEYNSLLVGFSNYASISNCYVSGTINIDANAKYSSGRFVSAGLITGAGIARIDNCSASGSINTNTLVNTYCGGIYGNSGSSNTSFNGKISNSKSSVKITADCASSLYAGGIIARSSSSIDGVDSCKFTGSITASNLRAAGGSTSSIPAYSGGIVGYSYSPITNSNVSDGTISTISEFSPTSGGIAGRTAHRIENCTSSDAVIASLSNTSNSSSPVAGGIAGTCGSSYNTLDSLAPTDIESIPAIRNCTVDNKASVSLTSSGGSFSVAGGIAGALHAPAEIENCVSNIGNITAVTTLSGEYIGGICGYSNGGKIKYSTSSGSISSDTSALNAIYAGGIAGSARTKRFLTYDTSYGVISDEFIATKVYGSEINGCTSDMTITGNTSDNKYFGGIAGYLSEVYSSDILHINVDRRSVIECSSFSGNIDINSDGSFYAGGIAGWNIDSKISNSYSKGNINCLSSDSTSDRYIGGAVGQISQNNHNVTDVLAEMNNCYSASDITSSDNNAFVNGFAASIKGSSKSNVNPKFSSCYMKNDGTVSPAIGVSALSDAEMKDQSSFQDWDFNILWKISDNAPALKLEYSDLYMPLKISDDGSEIEELLISRPKLNSAVYAVMKDKNGKFISAKTYKLNDELIQTTAFTAIPCDIALTDGAASCELYYWDSNDEPLISKIDLEEYINKFKEIL